MAVWQSPSFLNLADASTFPNIKPWMQFPYLRINIFIKLFLDNSSFTSTIGSTILDFMLIIEAKANRSQD